MTGTELTTANEGNGLSAQLDYARALSVADMLPTEYRNKPGNVLIAIGLGQSMGLSPTESLYRISVIKGKPTASAELITANVRKAGHRLRVETSGGKSTATIWRADDPEFPHVVTRDMEWAKRMGLASNDNYRKQAETMLEWRAITACARKACPEALYGVQYVADELDDIGPAPTRTAADIVGEPVHVEAEVVAPDTITKEAAEHLRDQMLEAGYTAASAPRFLREVTYREDVSTSNLTPDEHAAVLDALANRPQVEVEKQGTFGVEEAKAALKDGAE